MGDESECPELHRQVIRFADTRPMIDPASGDMERQAIAWMLLKATLRRLNADSPDTAAS